MVRLRLTVNSDTIQGCVTSGV